MTNPNGKSSRRRWVWAAFACLGSLALVYGLFVHHGSDGNAEAATSTLRLEDIPFDGARAHGYLKQLCDIGPRPSGSSGMAAQQKLLADHFRRFGAEVELQPFAAADPRDGRQVPMANLIVHWSPKKAERILLCAHYDTLPLPMRDRENPQGRFVGANDGASGVAVLMELGNNVSKIGCKYGIDFVLFDAEEYIFRPQDRFFLGSEYFAKQYRDNPARLSLPLGGVAGHGRRRRFADLSGAQHDVVARLAAVGRRDLGHGAPPRRPRVHPQQKT